MVYKAEEYFFNGVKVRKHVLNKYISWSNVLLAIKNGADGNFLLRERLGKGAVDMIHALKRDGLIVGSSNTRVATYTITEKGEQLIKDVKQYEKEKKDEKRRMFGDC